MDERGVVKLILKLLKSRNDYIRDAAAGALGGMVKHGAITHPHMILELTDVTQRNSGLP
jgi:hypothetical protein